MTRDRNPLELLARLANQDRDDDEPQRAKIAPDIEATLLRAALVAYNTRHEFQPGMIVRQKNNCGIYKNTSANGLSIVVEVLKEPITTGDDVSSCYFRIVNDLVIANLTPDGDFAVWHVDGRRFEPVPELQEEKFR